MGLFSRTPVIDARSAAARLAEEGVVIVDVRQHGEWDAGHIRGAIHIPLPQLSDQLARIPESKTVVTVCRSGHRSALAARTLIRAGRDALSLRGGQNAWTRAGLPLEQPRRRR